MSELKPMILAFEAAGENPALLHARDAAHLIAYGNELASLQSVPGVTVLATSTADAIHARVVVAAGVRVSAPVHLCFGLRRPDDVQNVRLELTLRAGAAATLWAHCLFAAADSARHAMKAEVCVEDGGELEYEESHYHGASGRIKVWAKASMRLGRGARYRSDFSLIQGRVGELDIDYAVDAGEDSVAELFSRVYGSGDDVIRLRERVDLNGSRSHALVKSRVVVRQRAIAEILGATSGNAEHARGHVDCMEIVRDEARASAMPQVRVTHPLAKVTHEAAIGSLDARQLEALMARGITPDEAVDVLVRGLLCQPQAAQAALTR